MSSRLGHILGGKRDAEFAPAPRTFAVGLYRASVQFHETSRHGESDTETAFAPASRAREETKNAWQVV